MPILPPDPDLDLPALMASGGHAPRYGVDVSTFLPSDPRVRSLFGGDWLGIGPAFTPISISSRTVIVPDIDLLTQSRSGNLAILAFGGAEVSRALSRPTGYFLPYAGAGLDLLFTHVGTDDVRFNSVSVAGSLFVGTRLGRNAYVEFRYREMPTLEGLNFSGTSITLGLRFF